MSEAALSQVDADFDGDGLADFAVFRPASGAWHVQGDPTTFFGLSSDAPVPADYNGDGITDMAVFRPSVGGWYRPGEATVYFGAVGDVPVPADYDGDGDDDIAVFRPSSGGWMRPGQETVYFGALGDVPVPADYDGDNDDDIAVWRPRTGGWLRPAVADVYFGAGGDVPVPADYDGDGDDDVAVFRTDSGGWLRPSQATVFFGLPGDMPVPANYDGDADDDVAVFRPSSGGWMRPDLPTTFFGATGDVPVQLPWAQFAAYPDGTAPTNITLSSSTVAENQPSGTTVGTLAAVDADAGDTAEFELVPGAGDADNGSFQIVGSTLVTNAVFNFETKASYSIRVSVADSEWRRFQKSFTITVANVNETPTDMALSNSAIAENQPSNTTVGTFSTTDPDAGDTFAYTLVSGAGSTDNASFTVSGNELRTAASFDFETKSSYAIRVRSTDAGALFFEKQFTVTVVNVNEAPVNTVPGAQAVDEDLDLFFSSGNGNAISIADDAAAGSSLKLSLDVLHGAITLASTAGLTFVDGTANGTASVHVTGTLANLNAALPGLKYRGTLNYNGPETLTVVTSDQGNTGTGGAQTDTDVVAITVNAVNDAPVADDEAFTGANGAIGNTTLIGNDPDDGAPSPSHAKKTISGDILAGDGDVDGPGPLTVTPGTFATNDGGSVTLEADGDFTFTPAPSTSCTDTSDFFDYTVEDAGAPEQTDTGRVTISIAGCVWYVSNNAAGNSGTSAAPFDTLAQAETASGVNHTVFVLDGDNTATGYGGDGYAMNAGERLLGEHEGLQVDPDGGGALGVENLHPANAGAHPTITATNADVVSIDDGNEIRGFNIDPQGTGGGIAGGVGDTGGGTIDDVNIVDGGTAGSQPGLELDATTGTFTVTNLVVNNSATGVRLNNAGTVNFAPTGTISITTAGASGLDATGTGLGTSTFDAITVTGSSSGGVSMTNTTGTTTFGALALTTTSGAAAAFQLSNAGAVTVAAAGTANLSATGGPAVDVTGTSGATLDFDAVSSTNSANDGINLAGLGTGTFNAASGAIGGAAGIAFDLDGGNGNVTFPGTITNGQGSTAEITGRSGGTVTLSGPTTDTGDADGTQENGGITLTGNTGGSTTLSHATKALNTGEDHAIVMGTSDGHTLTLSGGNLDIDTTSGNGLAATTSGTLTVTGINNTIATTTGTAVTVTDTDIGASGLTFQSISASGAASGIVLSATGSSGSLVVTGTGSTAVGGDSSGGTIQNTTAAGISLTDTLSPSFTNINIQSTARSGIDGQSVTNFALASSTINSVGTGAAGQHEESNIAFNDGGAFTSRSVSGTVSISRNVLTNARRHGIQIENGTGTISNLTISNNTMTSSTNSTVSLGSAILVLVQGSAATTAHLTTGTISANTLTGFPSGEGIAVLGGSGNVSNNTSGTLGANATPISITGNAISGGTGASRMGSNAIRVSFNGNNGVSNFSITNNGTALAPITNIQGQGISGFMGGTVTGTTTISGNFIVANQTLAAGTQGLAVQVDDGPAGLGTSAADYNFVITSNSVSNYEGFGIRAIARASLGKMDVTIQNNTVGTPILANRNGIRVDSGSAAGDVTVCLNMTGNTSDGSGVNQGIGLRKQGTVATTNDFGIVGLSPSPTSGANAAAKVATDNPAGGGVDIISGDNFVSCTITP